MALATPDEPEITRRALFKERDKVYPKSVKGRFRTLKWTALILLLSIYYITPWIRWDRGPDAPDQAVLIDMTGRRAYFFFIEIWPQQVYFLTGILIVAAIGLFLATSLFGRVWCGYACPQTVWTEVFIVMERWTEGRRLERMRLDAAPWSFDKLRRKAAKHALWFFFALWTGFTFVGFFTPITDLATRAWPFAWSGWETFWVLFYALATWGNAGFLREQVCKYMCPYARFQSAMFDRNSLIIAYDPMRGEPRGARKRSLESVLRRARGLLDKATAFDYAMRASVHPSAADARAQARGTITWDAVHAEPLPSFTSEQLGDCVDCTICVQVCPTGIDIRNGLQYECIACGACIDGCNEVMDKLGYPKGLIRYTTQNAIDGSPTRILRPRIIIYGVLLAAISIAWLWGVSHRAPFLVEVLRDRNALYRLGTDGSVENTYTIKIVNKSDRPARFSLELREAPAGATLRALPDELTAPAGEVSSLPVMVAAPAGTSGRSGLAFVLTDDTGVTSEVESSFFGPAAAP